jgi:alpha-glucosidase
LLASWNILSSHDTARIRTVVGSRERQIAALALAVGLPGVPLVFAGDEIGLTGWWGEDGRVPFPWHEESRWDHALRDAYRSLLTLRTSSPALQCGGLQWLNVEDDAVVFLRQGRSQSVLVVVSRTQTAPLRIPIWQWGAVQHRFGFAGRIEADHVVIDVPDAGASLWELS